MLPGSACGSACSLKHDQCNSAYVFTIEDEVYDLAQVIIISLHHAFNQATDFGPDRGGLQ